MNDLKPGVYAILDTTLGEITCRLFPDQAPKTVQNFRDLTEGSKEFVDSKTKARVKRRYYDGLVFHRVIPKFMIQGGCPQGTGTGGPGYHFEDEFSKDLGFDRPGKLAMANAGPNTNGSQFFITLAPTPHLDRKHSVFGAIVNGLDVVKKIGQVKTNTQDRPMTPVVMNKVTIERKA